VDRDLEQLPRRAPVVRDDQPAAVVREQQVLEADALHAVDTPVLRDFPTLIRTGPPASRCFDGGRDLLLRRPVVERHELALTRPRPSAAARRTARGLCG
jgi:hypothetical protein